MQKNEGVLDRFIRVILAGVFFYLGFNTFSGAASVVAYVLAAVMALTAFTGFCMLYKLLGIDTTKKG